MRTTLSLLIILAGCSSASTVGESSGYQALGTAGAGGTAASLTLPSSLAGRSGGRTGSAGTPTAEQNCGNSASTMSPLPADLLLVLDRSGSMTNDIASDDVCDPTTGACAERWSTMTQAMRQVLASSPASIHWGLKYFSSPGLSTGLGSTPMGCVVLPGVEAPIGDANSDSIVDLMGATTPNYNTPTRAAIETATAYLSTVQDGRAKYILLATDGQPNCPVAGDAPTAPDLPAALQAIAAARAVGFKVYVIGVGPSVGNLDEMARQGGTDKYYPALSPQSLVSALNTIVGIVASCVYTMSTTPPDPSHLGVYLDKQLVPQSPTDGWTAGAANSVVFTGPTCDRIKAGGFQRVEVLFGCPGVEEMPTVIP
jgi:hypothetical protein